MRLPNSYFVGLLFTYVILWAAYAVTLPKDIWKEVDPFSAFFIFFVNCWIAVVIGKFCVDWSE